MSLDSATHWALLAAAQQNTSELSLLSEHVHLTNTREKGHPFLRATLVNSHKMLLQRNYQVCSYNNEWSISNLLHSANLRAAPWWSGNTGQTVIGFTRGHKGESRAEVVPNSANMAHRRGALWALSLSARMLGDVSKISSAHYGLNSIPNFWHIRGVSHTRCVLRMEL